MGKSYLFSSIVNYFMAKLAGSSEKLCQDLLQDSKFSLGQVVVLVPLCIRAKEKPHASSPHRELALKPILWCTDACILCLLDRGWLGAHLGSWCPA